MFGCMVCILLDLLAMVMCGVSGLFDCWCLVVFNLCCLLFVGFVSVWWFCFLVVGLAVFALCLTVGFPGLSDPIGSVFGYSVWMVVVSLLFVVVWLGAC